ncbi:MAG: response regulator [Acidobacteriaceae bacterium]|nr:response regulator [Acidobacteriaceae bacterium]
MIPVKCLIADDADGARELLRYVLEGQEIEVIEARDGQEAIDLALEHTPDFVILDIGMPKVDGFGVVSALRGMPIFTATPILALTAAGGDLTRRDFEEAGFTAWLPKPIRPAIIRQALVDFTC